MSTKIRPKTSFERRRYYSFLKMPQTSKNAKPKIKKFEAEEYEKVIQELLEKIDYLESHLIETGMDKIKIVTSHKKLSLENNYLIKEIKKKDKKNEELKMKDLNNSQKIDRINRNFIDMRLSYDNKFNMLQKELRQKSEDINELNDKMKLKDNKILDMKINNDISNKEIQKQFNELNILKLTNKTLEEKIDKLQNELNRLYIEKRCEGNLLIENKHLKDDNVRLVELLSITQEFCDFAYLNQSLPGGIRYLNEIKIREMPPRMREKIVRDRIETLNSWIPGPVYETLLEFNFVHNLNMDEVLINELLYKLNKIYREKEEKNITKITTKFQKQILNLMTRYGIKNISAPYNIIEVEQIKKQVTKKLKQEQKKEKENQKRQERVDEVANFAKTATSHFFYNHKKKLDEQINSLKERLSIKILNNKKIENYNKIDITKGKDIILSNGSTSDTSTQNNKIKNQFERIKLNIDKLKKEYGKKIQDKNIGKNNYLQILKSSVEWFASSMKDIVTNSMNELLQKKN